MTQNVPHDGVLVEDDGQFDPYVVRGDTKPFANDPPKSNERGFDNLAPIWLDGCSVDIDATNSLGSITGDTKSDSMFDRYPSAKSDPDTDQSPPTNSADTVSSEKLGGTGTGGTKSDAMFERYPSTSSDEDDVGSK
jgi:hypothetical protein